MLEVNLYIHDLRDWEESADVKASMRNKFKTMNELVSSVLIETDIE